MVVHYYLRVLEIVEIICGKEESALTWLYLFRGTESRGQATLGAACHGIRTRDVPSDTILQEVSPS